MPSSEFTSLIERNAEFLSVRRTGRGDGLCGLYHSVNGAYIMGIGGGILPEFTFYAPHCVRGWRNILYDLVSKRHVRGSREIRRVMGNETVSDALEYGHIKAPFAPADESSRYAHEFHKSSDRVGA